MKTHSTHYINHCLPAAYLIVPVLFQLLFSLTGCNSRGNNTYQTYLVSNKNFENAITVSGFIESNRIVTITGPGLNSDLTITALVPEGSYVHKGDTVCYLQCTEIENQYKTAMMNCDVAKSELVKLLATQLMSDELLEAQIKNIKSQTSISELDTLSYKFYSPMKLKLAKLELQKAYYQKDKIEKKKNFLKRVDDAILEQQKLKIQKQESAVKNAGDNLLKLKLVSMADGYVEYVDRLWSTGAKAKTGDKVWGMMPILKISDMSSLQVKLLVNESHFKRIEKDQTIAIHLDAYPECKLTGKIAFKSPAGKPVKENSTLKMFEITGSIDPMTYKIQPGVSVTCMVSLSARKNVCAVPITAVFDVDSLKVVYILSKNGTIKRTSIKTGLSSDKEIVIEKGLQPNEIILLSEPSEKSIQ